MTHNPSPLEHLFLLRLAVAGGGGWKKEIKPELDSPVRQRLIDAGLIEAEKRKPESGGRSRPLMYIALTDQGWAWLSEHFDAKLPPRANTAETLQLLLARLKAYFDATRISLAEFINSSPDHQERPPLTDLDHQKKEPLPAELNRQIKEAYYRLSEGRPNIRVRLADLRSVLPGVPRGQLDAALLNIETQDYASLYRMDDPLEIRPEDRDAVLRTPSGEERHIIYFGGPGS